MQKLKKKKINKLLNYQQFLKNNYLKTNKTNFKKVLFENPILYKNLDSNILELNNYENVYLPFTLINLKDIYTIKVQYENKFLFNYDLNYDIIHNFNKIIFKNILEKNNNKIKGRITGGNNKKILVLILGIIFSMNPINLNSLVNNKKTFYLNKKIKNKKKFYISKKIKPKQLINSYKLRYINFKVNVNLNLNSKKKYLLSRILYIQDIIRNQKKNKNFKKSVLSRKINVHEINQKNK